MEFFYNPRKATQAVAYLVSLSGGSMDLWRMLKLVYLFDRASIIETGASITGDALDSLPFGPTPSRIYDNTKTERDDRHKDRVWREYLTESVNNEVRLQSATFLTSELSQFERDIIKKTWLEYANCPTDELWKIVHSLPEYQNPQGSSLSIDPEQILRAAEWTSEEIENANRNARREKILNQLCR
jgi:uncharacterized phage-associated protein